MYRDSDSAPEPDGRRSWVVAFAGALAMVFTFGTPYSYGVFLGPFGETYGISPVALSTVFSVELFTFYAGAGVVGVLSTRLPARAVVLASGGLAALVAPSLYLVDSFAGLVAVFGLLGIPLGTAFVVLASVVPRWFERRRGLATGILFAGNGLGLFVLPPAWQLAFARLGVRRGFLIIVAASAGSFLLAGVTCRRPPWAERSSASPRDLVDWLRRLAGTRSFQLLFVGIGLAFAWYYLLAAYAIDLFTARGLTETGASIVFGAVGGVSIVSRLGSGAVADAAGYRRTFLASLGCSAAGSLFLFVPRFPAMVVAVFLFGIGLGGIATLYIPVLMRTYSPEKDTAVVGVFNVAFGVFALAAPPAGTALIAVTGSHDGVVLLTLASTLVAIAGVSVGTRAA